MNIVRKDILITLILSVGLCLASEDFDNSNPTISDVFDRGSILVYDCNGKNTVCASEPTYLYCKEFNPKDRPCRQIKAFESNSECEKFQLKIVSDNYIGRFCDFY